MQIPSFVKTAGFLFITTALLISGPQTASADLSAIGPIQSIDYPGATQTQANATDGTNVVGFYQTGAGENAGRQFAFYFDGTNYTTIDPPNATNSVATAIFGGTIVGNYDDTDGFTHGFSYVIGAGTFGFIDYPGTQRTQPVGISSGGICGYYDQPPVAGTTFSGGFVFSGGVYTAIAPAGSNSSGAAGISGGNIVGSYATSVGANLRGFFFSNGTYKDIPAPANVGVFPNGVDGANVAGTYDDKSFKEHGFFYNGTKFTTLTVPGAIFTQGIGVSGTILAGNYGDSEGTHGFIWNGTTYRPFDFPGSHSTMLVEGISGNAVVGYYTDSSNASHGYLATIKAAATVKLTNLTQMADGLAKSPTATTTPAGLNVQFTYNGSSTTPTAAGTYSVVALVNDPNFAGSATGTMVITPNNGKPEAVKITLNGLAATYDTNPHAVTATTVPGPVTVDITYNGSPTPPTAVGSYAVVATVDQTGFQGTAKGTLKIGKGSAGVILSDTTATYDGTPHAATATTVPSGLNVTFKYGSSATPPTNAGTYFVTATVNDPNYQAVVTTNLVIAKAAATVTINLPGSDPVYDGKTHPVTATTVPAGLKLVYTYNGTAKLPVNAGSYTTVATVNDVNYTGSDTQTLVIDPAPLTVTLGSLTAVFNNKPHAATATTAPAKTTVTFTYDGNATPPSAVGSYAVVGTVSNPNYTGSANGTLQITPIPPLAVTGVATAIAANTATLNGTVNPETTDTQVSFNWGLTTSYGNTTTPQDAGSGAANTPVSTGLTSLVPGTTYHYRIVANNGTTTVNGADKTFVTLLFPTINPALPPQPLVAASGANISLSINPQGLATQVMINYGTDTSYGSTTTIANLKAGTKSFVTLLFDLPGLLPNTTYHFQIETVNAAGTWTSEDMTFTTLAFDTTLVQKSGDAAADAGGATFSSFGATAVNSGDGVAFGAKIAGSGVTAANSLGIWANDSLGDLHLVAQSNAATPDLGGALFSSFSDPVYNDAAQLAFKGQLQVGSGVTAATASGIWSSSSGTLALVAQLGTPAPSGTNYQTLDGFAISDVNTVVVGTMSIGGGVTANTNWAIWEGTQASDLFMAVRSGDVNDSKILLNGSLTSTQAIVGGQTRGVASNTGDLCLLANFTDKTNGVLLAVQGVESILAQQGDEPAGVSGATYSTFGSPIINTQDHVAFRAVMTNGVGGVTATTNSGIWADDGTGTSQLIAQTGQAGSSFLTLTDPVYNDNETVAFGATYKVGSVMTTGLFDTSGGSVSLVAQTGDDAPGCTTGTKFATFTTMALPDTDGLVFLGTVTGGGATPANNTGIWMVDGNGDLQLIVRTGDALLPGKTVASLSFLPFSAVTSGQSRSFAKNGELAYVATFTDKTTAIFNVVVSP